METTDISRIVYELVRIHQDRIRMESEDCIGNCFREIEKLQQNNKYRKQQLHTLSKKYKILRDSVKIPTKVSISPMKQFSKSSQSDLIEILESPTSTSNEHESPKRKRTINSVNRRNTLQHISVLSTNILPAEPESPVLLTPKVLNVMKIPLKENVQIPIDFIQENKKYQVLNSEIKHQPQPEIELNIYKTEISVPHTLENNNNPQKTENDMKGLPLSPSMDGGGGRLGVRGKEGELMGRRGIRRCLTDLPSPPLLLPPPPNPYTRPTQPILLNLESNREKERGKGEGSRRRSKQERDPLPGFSCPECVRYYEALAQQGIIPPEGQGEGDGGAESERGGVRTCSHRGNPLVPPSSSTSPSTTSRNAFLSLHSRHKYRAVEAPVDTPEGFWDLSLHTPEDWREGV